MTSTNTSTVPPRSDWGHLELVAHADAWPMADSRRRVLLVAVNMPGYYSLPVRILALAAQQDPATNKRFDTRYVEIDNTETMATVAERLACWSPEIIGFSVNIWNRLQATDLVHSLKSLCSDACMVFGGQEVTHSTIDFLELIPDLDFIIDGEGEIAFLQFLKAWTPQRPWIQSPAHVSGLHYRKNGHSEFTGPAALAESLDDVPSAVLAGLVKPDQRNLLGVMLEGSRGCPFRCSFCFEGGKHNRIRNASLERLRREAEYMASRGAGYFHIMDPILCNSELSRLRGLTEVFETLRAKNPRTVISVEIYAHQVTDALAECLKSCTIIDVGLQTTHAPTAKAIHRPWQPEKFRKGLQRLRAARVPFNIYLICGLPEETITTFLDGILTITAEQPTRIFCNELCLLNGTELRRRSAEYGYRFDPQPPYQVRASAWMPENELKMAQVISKIVEKKYNLSARAIYTTSPWLPKTPPQYGAVTRIDLDSPCSMACAGCERGCLDETRLPDRLQELSDRVQDHDVEISVGDLVDTGLVLNLVGQLQLYAAARIRLVGPPGLFADPDAVKTLVHRGVWHFRTFRPLAGTENRNAIEPALSEALVNLNRKQELTGFAVIRPFTEVVMALGDPLRVDPVRYARSIRAVAEAGTTMITIPAAGDGMSPAARAIVTGLFDELLGSLQWLKLPPMMLKTALASVNSVETVMAGIDKLGLVSTASPHPPCYQTAHAAESEKGTSGS